VAGFTAKYRLKLYFTAFNRRKNVKQTSLPDQRKWRNILFSSLLPNSYTPNALTIAAIRVR